MKDAYRFLLRLPQPVRVRLVDAAAKSGRSLNAEIVHRLERSLDPWPARRARLSLAAACLAAVAAGVTAAELTRNEPAAEVPRATTFGPALVSRVAGQ